MITPRHLVLVILASGCLVALVGCGDNSTGTNDNNQNNANPVCGNGSQEGIEECDGADLGGETCVSQGLPGGPLNCYGNCTFDTTACDPPVTCGNGIIDTNEECDGSNLNGQTCITLGYASGTLTCAANCQFNESLCETGPECGDGNIDAGEQCDGANLDNQTCITRGYASGTLSCNSTTCQFDESQCVPDEDCGNGQIDTGEQCDGSNLNSQTCATQGLDGGSLGCTGGCLFDTSGCFDCGDGVRNGIEDCDTTDFGTSTCTSEASHSSGSLSCTASCTIDSSSCYTCGDTQLDGPEVCDDANVGTETCQTQASLAEGTLACASSCLAFDTSDCHDCGNGVAEGPEACDTADFGTATCQTEASLTDGTLTCLGDCTIVTSDCYECGNSTIEGPEVCDDTNLNGETCQSQAGSADGTLYCSVDCLGFDTSDCHECGNGVLEGGEECDGDVYTDSCISLGYGTGAIACDASCQLDTSQCVTCTWQWSPISSGPVGAPEGTYSHSAVWMPEYGKMWISGGLPVHNNSGHMYNPVANDWESAVGCGGGDRPEAVWTGTKVLLWLLGGGIYDPFAQDCGPMQSGTPAPTVDRWHSSIWTGTEMIVWGGGSSSSNYGARYDPVADSWTPTSQGANCPSIRKMHASVWTGTEMIVWGGGTSGTNTGGRYNPGTDTWLPTSTGTNCPTMRTYLNHTAVWTGTRMVIWGGHGRNVSMQFDYLDTGGSYDPVTDSWMSTSAGPNLPYKRAQHTSVWTGSEVIIWGGEYYNGSSFVSLNDGGHYDPVTDSWRPTALGNAPHARNKHTAVWTGNEMIIWSGSYDSGGSPVYLQNGARYWCGP